MYATNPLFVTSSWYISLACCFLPGLMFRNICYISLLKGSNINHVNKSIRYTLAQEALLCSLIGNFSAEMGYAFIIQLFWAAVGTDHGSVSLWYFWRCRQRIPIVKRFWCLCNCHANDLKQNYDAFAALCGLFEDDVASSKRPQPAESNCEANCHQQAARDFDACLWFSLLRFFEHDVGIFEEPAASRIELWSAQWLLAFWSDVIVVQNSFFKPAES